MSSDFDKIEDELILEKVEERKKSQRSYEEHPEDYMVDEEIFDYIDTLKNN